MSVDFNSLLSTKVDDAEKPKPLPTGSFIFAISTEQPKLDVSKQKQTPFVEFMAKPMSPLDDVDPSLLQQVKNWRDKTLRLTFYLTDDAKYRLKEFLDKIGVPHANRTFGECLPEVVGKTFKATIKHEIADKSKEPYAVIDDSSIAAA